MYCTNCGTELEASANFCGRCGQATNPQAANQAYFRATASASAGEVRLLERPADGKWLVGVCLAFANYFRIDPALVRILWLCTVVFFGTGALAYLICWIIIPQAPPRSSIASKAST
jgi:phage shock protein PspC (stress-responsive transcriptional regulator)